MYRNSFIKTIFASVTLFLTISCEKEIITPSDDLPVEISTYLTIHFPKNTIVQVIKDLDGLTKTYDILLSENISLEFNRKKVVIAIDGVTQLPNSVIPEKILQYVNINYPTQFITDWELDFDNQQIELNNGLDLEFNKKGDFLRIDN
jgi:hypothetical protein